MHTSQITIFLVLLVFWIIGYLVIRSLEVGRDKKYELSVRNLAAMSVFLVIYNIYLNVASNDRIEKNRRIYNTLENIQRNWLLPQKELLEHYPEGYFLYASMTPDAGLDVAFPETYDPLKRRQIEVYYSLRIYQAMEDFLSTGSYDITGKEVWVNNFLMWMQSPILQKNWRQFAFNYSGDTRDFIDRIIAESEKLAGLRKQKGKLETADYDAIAKKFEVEFR